MVPLRFVHWGAAWAKEMRTNNPKHTKTGLAIAAQSLERLRNYSASQPFLMAKAEKLLVCLTVVFRAGNVSQMFVPAIWGRIELFGAVGRLNQY